MTNKIKLEIDPRHYNLVTPENYKKALPLLAEVHAALWIEACYDPYNKHPKKFAKPLCDKMMKVNKLLGFKK